MVKIPQNIYLSNVLNSLENLKRRYDIANNIYQNANKKEKEKEKARQTMVSIKEYLYKRLNEEDVFSIICDGKPNQFEDFYVETDVPIYIDVLKKHIETLKD